MGIELSTLRHTASHVMAQAVKKLFPEAKLQYELEFERKSGASKVQN